MAKLAHFALTFLLAVQLSTVCGGNGRESQAVPLGGFYHGGGDTFRLRWFAEGGQRDPLIGKRVYEWQPESGTERVVFEGPFHLLFVQAQEKRIAFIEKDTVNPWPIVIIDKEGQVCRRTKNKESVRRFVWNPEGTCIAYITGFSDEAYPNGLRSEGVWVYDLDTRDSTHIADTGHEISWPSFDGCVYIDVNPGRKDHAVLRYNPHTQILEQTEFWSTDFSSDGEFYLYFSDITGFQVYDRQTNLLIRELPDGTDLAEVLKRIGVCRWLTPSGLYILLSEPAEPVYRQRHLILDVESGELRESEAVPIGPCGENAVIVMKKGGALALQRISQMLEVSAKDTVLSIQPHPFLEP